MGFGEFVASSLAVANLKSIKDATMQLVKFIGDQVRRVPAGELSKQRQTTVGLVLVFLGCHLYYWRKYTFWSRRGIKGPRPLPIIGNMLSFTLNPRQKLELEWRDKYGKLYGIYLGTKPFLVLADAEVIRQICVKDFHLFVNHYLVGVPNKYQRHFLALQKDDHWRGLRAIMTPTFSGAKIKSMVKAMDSCAEELAQQHRDLIARSTAGKATVECHKLYASLSMACSLSCFFGVQAKSSGDNVDESQTKEGFAKRSRLVNQIGPVRFLMANLLPLSVQRTLQFSLIPSSLFDFFSKNAHRVINQRKKSGNRNHADYLQLLIDARGQSKEIRDEHRLASDQHEDHHAQDMEAQQTEGSRPSRMRLTEEEVTCQAMMFMVAATETTGSLITNCLFLLANYPDLQERLYKEVAPLAQVGEDGSSRYKFDYEQLTSLPYLDCVISETLRVISSVLAIDRVASEDYYVEKYDLTIPKGTVINLGLYAVAKDPDYWTDPERFDPERFNAENKKNIVPGSYVPFGIGPRACIGFRFALAEAKIAIAKLLCEFKFEKAPGYEYPPEYKGMVFLAANNTEIRVNISRR